MNQDIKYHGLRNQGATCYLNSILQVLFVTREFREAVKRCPKENGDINVQLNVLFEELKGNTAETTKVTEKLQIENVHEQQDAGQYLEKILSLVSDEASQIFRGELVHRTVCDGCHSHTEDFVPFLFLSLPLMDSSSGNYSVEDAIQEYLKDVRFYGEDQLYCDTCKGQRDTTVKYELTHHPEILILLLKRFEFNYHGMSYSKDSGAVDVCHTIVLPETYKLYGLVDHVGTLSSGHYTAIIKPEDEEHWYEFNDSSVTLVGNQTFQKKIARSRSAHLLFYRKKNTEGEDEGTDGDKDQKKLKDDDKSENDDTGKMTSDCDKNYNRLYFSLLALLLFVSVIIWIVISARKVLPNEFILRGLLFLLGLAFLRWWKCIKKANDWLATVFAHLLVRND